MVKQTLCAGLSAFLAIASWTACVQSSGEDPVANATSASTASCYAGHGSCDPTSATSCAGGEACGITITAVAHLDGGNEYSAEFECWKAPNKAQLGDACDLSAGPTCAHGLACRYGTCVRYCCDDSVCSPGTTCTATGDIFGIVRKVCVEPEGAQP